MLDAAGLSQAALTLPCGDAILDMACLEQAPRLAGQQPLAQAAVQETVKAPVSKQRGVRGGRRAARRHPNGITPEHMLYWVSQADVAMQLRCDGEPDAAPSIAASQHAPSLTSTDDVSMGDVATMTMVNDQAFVVPDTAKQCLPSRQHASQGNSHQCPGRQHEGGQPNCTQRKSKRKQCV